MRTRTIVSGLALTAGLALGLVPAGASTAVTAGHGKVTVSRHAAATTKAEQRRVVSYWTPARMKAAVPWGSERELKGKPGGGGSGSGSAVKETPQPTYGKVFFTEGRTNYVCSGTATASGNGDVVTTAGHCVNAGPGAYVTNFAFVPAYDNGAAPYGTWTAQTLLTTDAWKNSGDFNFDVGFAVMNENASNQSLTQVVPGSPIAFNLARGLSYKAYGYPAASPFNGQSLYSCSGTVVQDTVGGSTDQGLACTMTGGSSGGGWITGGSLNSVTSFGYTSVKNVLWGPYFGTVIQSVYNAAAATP
jgi:hypothetical protein